ncbi:MAG: hypothetical protein CL678_04185 [Bdellovibrionaceae bacterium]|nr:hypothetical protein [Pseudobdellovibrionaceae bacterium]
MKIKRTAGVGFCISLVSCGPVAPSLNKSDFIRRDQVFAQIQNQNRNFRTKERSFNTHWINESLLSEEDSFAGSTDLSIDEIKMLIHKGTVDISLGTLPPKEVLFVLNKEIFEKGLQLDTYEMSLDPKTEKSGYWKLSFKRKLSKNEKELFSKHIHRVIVSLKAQLTESPIVAISPH